jgi:hypothetical protein
MGRAQDMKVLLWSFCFSLLFPPEDRYGRVRVLNSGAGSQVLREVAKLLEWT